MNYIVEFYIDQKYYSILSEDIKIISNFVQKYLDLAASQKAIEKLLIQADAGKFPNLIYFISNDEFISIEEFKNGLHKRR